MKFVLEGKSISTSEFNIEQPRGFPIERPIGPPIDNTRVWKHHCDHRASIDQHAVWLMTGIEKELINIHHYETNEGSKDLAKRMGRGKTP